MVVDNSTVYFTYFLKLRLIICDYFVEAINHNHLIYRLFKINNWLATTTLMKLLFKLIPVHLTKYLIRY